MLSRPRRLDIPYIVKNKWYFSSENAESSVIGVILLVALTCLLAAVVVAFAFGIGGSSLEYGANLAQSAIFSRFPR